MCRGWDNRNIVQQTVHCASFHVFQARRGGKEQKFPGQKLCWRSACPADQLGPQVQSKPVSTRTQQGRCFNRGGRWERRHSPCLLEKENVSLVCKGGRGMRMPGKGEHCRAKQCFDTSQEFSQHLQSFLGLKRWIRPAVSHLANSSGSFFPRVFLIITAKHDECSQELCQQHHGPAPQPYACSVTTASPPDGYPG